MKTRTKIMYVVVYLLLLVPSITQMAMLWTWFAPDRLYHCSDDWGPMPPWEWFSSAYYEQPFAVFYLVYRFICRPTFFHVLGGSASGGDAEYSIWPAPIVDLVWLGFIAFGLLFPAFVIWLFRRGVRYSRGPKETKQ